MESVNIETNIDLQTSKPKTALFFSFFFSFVKICTSGLPFDQF